MITRYKFLNLENNKIKSNSGNCVWKIRELKKHRGSISMCSSGFHCSKNPYQAFSYVQGEVLAIVSCGGKSEIQDDKEVYSEMRIIKAYRWTKKDSVALAIYSAELVLDIYEKQYPNDKRPRLAIESARKVLKNDTEKNRSAAESAARSAARSAESAAWSAAESAAWSAAWSAWSAARSAESAARSAARSAESAARSARSAARSAAWSAAWSALIENIKEWFENRVKTLEEIK